MRSVVVKIVGKKAILLQSNDEFISLPNKNYSLGQVINVDEQGGVTMIRLKRVAIAAAFILVLLSGSFVYAYASPQNYMSLDVNPGIELEINMFNRVITAVGTNEDGTEVLKELKLENKLVNEALQLILSQAVMQGYLSENTGNSILISVYNDDEENLYRFRERIYNQIENVIRERNIEAEVIAVNVDKNLMSQAEDLGITAGKLALITAYNDYEYSTRTQEELMNMSIYDILSTIENKEQFFENEDMHKTIDTVSGASNAENNGESVNGNDVDTASGASADMGNGENGGSFVDTGTGASADMGDEYYDDEEDDDMMPGDHDRFDERDEHDEYEDDDEYEEDD